MWTVGAETLVLVANMGEAAAEVTLPLREALTLQEVIGYGVRRARSPGERQIGLDLEALGCAVFVASPPAFVLNAQEDEL